MSARTRTIVYGRPYCGRIGQGRGAVAAAALAGALALAAGAGCQKNRGPVTPHDTIRPAPVNDLYGIATGTRSIRLTWTAVGGDSLTGLAESYDLRVTANPADSFAEMDPVSGLPTPGEPGTRDSVTVTGLTADVAYRFLMKVADAQGNVSALSNQAVVVTLASDNDVHWWPGFAPPPHGKGTDGSVLALIPYGSDLIAGGDFEYAGGVRASHVAAWDGAGWSALGPGLNGPVVALAEYNGRLYAGGSFTQSGSGRAMYIASWDGDVWSSSRAEPDGSIDALTVYGGNLIVAGGFTHVGDVAASHIAAWNGGTWTPLGTGADDWVTSLTVWNNDLIAGGYFRHAGGDSAVYVARWDGAAWHSLGVGSADQDSAGVTSLAVHDGLLYAGGTFQTIGGTFASFLASWDGGAWQEAGELEGGSFIYPGVFAVGALGSHLVTAGRFANAVGCAVNCISTIDPGSCGALGSGIGRQEYRIVLALAEWQGSLYAGGTFQFAGNRPSAGIARWIED